MRILLAAPRGFCAGVSRAVDIVELALRLFEGPIYVLHEIVHNNRVVRELRDRGAVFIENVDDAPAGCVLIFSAHGVAPAVVERAKARGCRLFDATCPLVTKVHVEALRYASEGYHILYIGHRGHPEVEGVIGVVPGHIDVIESVEEAQKVILPPGRKPVALTQTTLSVLDAETILSALYQHFPDMRRPATNDICYATSNRQYAALELAKRCDVVFVLGSPQSSNANRLAERVRSSGVPAYLIEDARAISPRLLDGVRTLGLTSGASTPEETLQEVLAYLASIASVEVEEVPVVPEDVIFRLPPELEREATRHGNGLEILAAHDPHQTIQG